MFVYKEEPLFLTDLQIASRYGVSRQTIWRWKTSNPEFPKPVKLSKGCVRWHLSDLERWEQMPVDTIGGV